VSAGNVTVDKWIGANELDMSKTSVSDPQQELQLLEALQDEPEAKQAELASEVGMSVGKVNWTLKRLAGKGFIKIKQIGRWRWEYLLTPKGIAEKARLTAAYVKNSMTLYRETRLQALEFFSQVRAAGYEGVCLEGDGELLEICRLTGIEQNTRIMPAHVNSIPVIRQKGTQLRLEWPQSIEAVNSVAEKSEAGK
jgi:DNA-binding MarR family transcriptional regulator